MTRAKIRARVVRVSVTGKAFAYGVDDRPFGMNGDAEIAFGQRLHPYGELLVEGKIQPQCLAHRGHVLGGGVRAEDNCGRVAGDHVDEHEHHRRHQYQRGDQVDKAFNEKFEHA